MHFELVWAADGLSRYRENSQARFASVQPRAKKKHKKCSREFEPCPASIPAAFRRENGLRPLDERRERSKASGFRHQVARGARFLVEVTRSARKKAPVALLQGPLQQDFRLPPDGSLSFAACTFSAADTLFCCRYCHRCEPQNPARSAKFSTNH